MGITVDPLVFIRDWLSENWNGTGLGFTPTFVTGPYKKGSALPLVTIIGFPARPTHLNLGSTYHYYYTICGVELYSSDKDEIWDMKQETRRIIYANQKNPTTTTYTTPGIEHILIYEEFPQNNYKETPPLLSESIRVYVVHLETNS